MSGETGFTPEEIERGEDRAWHIPLWGCLAAAALLGGLIYMGLGAIGLAVSSAESRPELLRDAEWGKQGSARSFERRFQRGTPESGLLSWLGANRFTIDRSAGRASRRIESLPCNERIDVGWTIDNEGGLISATAMVYEAGCP